MDTVHVEELKGPASGGFLFLPKGAGDAFLHFYNAVQRYQPGRMGIRGGCGKDVSGEVLAQQMPWKSREARGPVATAERKAPTSHPRHV